MDPAVDPGLVIEFHLELGGVDVDVRPPGIDAQEEDEEGEAPLLQEMLVRPVDGVAQVPADDRAAVEENVLLGTALPGDLLRALDLRVQGTL